MMKTIKTSKEKTKIKNSNNSGITLIALVVTIVVLLILAGITITAVLSEGGIFNTAQNAEKAQQQASVKEKVQIMLADAQLEKLINNKTLKTYLEEQGYPVTQNVTAGTTKITVDGYDVTIEEDTLEITTMEKTEGSGGGSEYIGAIEISPDSDTPTLQSALAALDEEKEVILVKDSITWETGAQHNSTPLVPETNTVTKEIIIEGATPGTVFTATGQGISAICAANGATLIFRNLKIIDESVSESESSWEFTYLEFDGKIVFENCEFTSGILIGPPAAELEDDVEFKNCTFSSLNESEYCLWISSGHVSVADCAFLDSGRAIHIHEEYGSEVSEVIVDNCTFEGLTVKPAVRFGTLNTDTIITLKNNTIKNVQPGKQGLYLYETNTDVTTFTFIEQNNNIIND